MESSGVSLLTAVVTAVVVFLFTSAWITAKAARNTLRINKASIAPARKAVWKTLGSLFKIGLIAAVLALSLVAWALGEADKTAGNQPSPAPSVSAR